MNLLARPLAIVTALALAGTALPALAMQVGLSATLSGAEEVPPNGATATGMMTGDYDSETNVLNFSVTYEGLSGDATAAHFHGPASPGENAPPTVPVDGALASPIAGTATLTDAQEAELLAGMWYFNVHTAQYPDGEIRGQVFQSMMSTEASSMSSEASMMSSEMPSSEMSSELSSVSSELSSVASSAVSSVSSELSSVISSVSSEVSSAVSSVSSEVSSAVSSVSSELSSILDPSVSVSASAEVSVSGEVSVSVPTP